MLGRTEPVQDLMHWGVSQRVRGRSGEATDAVETLVRVVEGVMGAMMVARDKTRSARWRPRRRVESSNYVAGRRACPTVAGR